MKKKPNPKPTINDTCAICGRPYAMTHEVYFGNPNAALSQKYGMTIRLCYDHHQHPKTGVHFNKEFRYQMQQEYKQKFAEMHPDLDFYSIFKSNFERKEI